MKHAITLLAGLAIARLATLNAADAQAPKDKLPSSPLTPEGNAAALHAVLNFDTDVVRDQSHRAVERHPS